jgi:hypothetical protein
MASLHKIHEDPWHVRQSLYFLFAWFVRTSICCSKFYYPTGAGTVSRIQYGDSSVGR